MHVWQLVKIAYKQYLVHVPFEIRQQKNSLEGHLRSWVKNGVVQEVKDNTIHKTQISRNKTLEKT